MSLDDYVVAVISKRNHYLVYNQDNDKSYVLEEWPKAKFVKLDDYPDKNKLADMIIEETENELTSANRHSISSLPTELYSGLIKICDNRLEIAKIIFNNFYNI